MTTTATASAAPRCAVTAGKVDVCGASSAGRTTARDVFDELARPDWACVLYSEVLTTT